MQRLNALLCALGCARIVDQPRERPADAAVDSDIMPETAPLVDTSVLVDTATNVDTFVVEAEASVDDAVVDDAVDSADTPPVAELVATLTMPRAVAVGSGYAFVTTLGTTPALFRIPIAGGAPIKVEGSTRPTYVSVDSTHVYWSDSSDGGAARSGAIRRAPILGGAAETLAKDLEQPNSARLAFGNIYFAQGVTADSTVMSVPTTGGPTTTIATTGTWSSYVAVNSTVVCWARKGMSPSIECAPRGGGTTTTLTSEDTWSLAIDDTYAYYGPGPAIKRVPLAGGAPETLATTTDYCAADMAIDATNVYVVCMKSVVRVPKKGGALTVLSTAVRDDFGWAGIAIDATHVYWTSPSDDAVRRIPK